MMEAVVYKSLDEIDPALWDSILKPDHLISSHGHLLAVEKSHINDCDYRYIMVTENGLLLAHTCMYSISFELDALNQGFTVKFINFVRRHFYGEFMKIKVIECGTPTALGNTISMADEIDREQALELIVRKMEEYAREKKFKILLLRDFTDAELEFYDRLKKLGFDRINNLPNSEIVNNWTSFDAYLDDMRSRYRYRLHKFIKSLKSDAVTIEVRDEFAGLAPQLRDLWRQIYERATEYKREILTPEYFANMSRCLKGRTKIILFRKEGRLIGFNFVIIDDDTLRPLFIGMDYAHNQDNSLYFNILCQAVKMGIELGKKSIEMGITTLNPKMEMGSVMYPLYGYMKHLSPVKSWILTGLFKSFTPPYREIEKHVYNRRFYERIYHEAKLTVIYRNREMKSETRNISMSGVQVATSCLLKKGDPAEVRFTAANPLNAFTVKARVAWSRAVSEGCEAGLQFRDVTETQKDRLENLIAAAKDRLDHGED
jgi:predicted N-acyltransferase